MLITLIYIIVLCIIFLGFVLSVGAVSTIVERRIAGYIQDRIGPNRVGPYGVLQVAADGIKLFFKEDFFPSFVNKTLFWITPVLAFIPGMISIAIVPIGSFSWTTDDAIVLADINVGILFFMAISSLTAYGIAYSGWSSHSKYSLIGGLRGAAQLISFELAMGLSLISIFLVSGGLTLKSIVAYQMNEGWLIFTQPLAFIIFLTAGFAETNRTPFDIPEAEQEVVSGYHTEFSSTRFGLFMFGEYIAMFTMSTIITALFLGGWDIPFFSNEGFGKDALLYNTLLSIGVFMFKTLSLMFFFMWVRWTLPRFRWDQLMKLGWKVLVPLALLNIVITAIIMVL